MTFKIGDCFIDLKYQTKTKEAKANHYDPTKETKEVDIIISNSETLYDLISRQGWNVATVLQDYSEYFSHINMDKVDIAHLNHKLRRIVS